MSNNILLMYPAALLGLVLLGVQIKPKGEFHEDFLSLENTKIMQGIACICVILHHLTQAVTKYGARWKGPITHLNWMGILFTSVFFFCSGYGLLKSYQDKPDYIEHFLYRRIPSVLLPFMISNVIYVLADGFLSKKISNTTDVITSLLGFTLLNGNTWFLVEIMILYLIFYAAYRWIKNKKAALAAVAIFTAAMIVGSLLLGHDSSKINGHWFMGEWWCNSTIVFVFGMLTAEYEQTIIKFIKKHYQWLLPLAVVGFVGLFRVSEHVEHTMGYYCEWEGHPGTKEKFCTLLAQSAACVSFMAAVLLLNMKVKFHNRILVLFGKMSLSLYIIHDMVKQIVLQLRPFGKRLSDFQFFLAVFIGCAVAAPLLYMVNTAVIQKYLSKQRRKNV